MEWAARPFELCESFNALSLPPPGQQVHKFVGFLYVDRHSIGEQFCSFLDGQRTKANCRHDLFGFFHLNGEQRVKIFHVGTYKKLTPRLIRIRMAAQKVLDSLGHRKNSVRPVGY